jgi:hypothetical protein
MSNKERRIRTSFVKGPLIFASVALICNILVIVLFAIFEPKSSIALVCYIFCSIFIIVSIPILLDQLFHYDEVKGDYLINHVLFVTRKIKISKIDYIIKKDEVFEVYLKNGKKFTSINAYDPMVNDILYYLDKKGAKLK